MGDRLGIAHPIHVLLGATTALGSLPAGLGGFALAGIDLAGIRGKWRGSSPAPAPAAPGRHGGPDPFERVDFALASRTSMPWTL